MTLVSVILPTFNRAHCLRRAACSVLAQSHSELELVIVDDASSDDTHDVVRKLGDPRVRYVRLDRNSGPAAARNAGIKLARHALIAFQDSDDEWLPGKLAAQLATLAAAPPEVALVSCGLVRHDPPAVFVFPPPVLLHGDSRRTIRMHAIAFSQTWLVRREIFDRYGLFDEKLRIWEDWEFLLRVTRGHRVHYLADRLVLSYLSADAISASTQRRIDSLERIVTLHPTDKYLRGRLHYLVGRFAALSGDALKARRFLWMSIHCRPLYVRAWALLVVSVAGADAMRSALSLRSKPTKP
ncbi:MAG TPA: glycosyltransferase [Verrucomicrobiae bacterium]|nr:glycosyltransferase [Verrucomicrobiae bacterium]